MAVRDLDTAAGSPAVRLEAMLAQARAATRAWQSRHFEGRDAALGAMALSLRARAAEILAANRQDVERAHSQGLPTPLLKRLTLDAAGLERLVAGMEQLTTLRDPLGVGRGLKTLPNGLRLEAVSVPLGVIALIYESRPGVTVEAGGLAIKSGNALILRGGSEAMLSNRALAAALGEGLETAGLSPHLIQWVDSPDRAYVEALMHLDGLDLLIPRGGPSLIQRVKREATVPVIETGVGNCHVYVDRAADLDMAVRVVVDAKVGNPAVCNAAETLLVHEAVAPAFLPRVAAALGAHGVVLHAEPLAKAWLPEALDATERDFTDEYLSLDLAVKVVPDIEAAVQHIDRYGTGHSEAIVTEDYTAGTYFQQAVDAAVVYWNASTRFTDGFQFGLGAEVGISTQKLHARGPMGLEALTTVKTLVMGHGQTRDL
jgi:glutamate-5-semialdehyde dehydrogenase